MPLDQPFNFDEDLQESTMSFGDHLDELRKRLLYALAVPVPLMILTWIVSTDILNLICAPLIRALRREGLSEQLQVLSPAEAMLTQLKICIITALIMSAPWIVYQLWLFIKPGLYRQERRFVYFLVPGSAILTAASVALLYFAMLPFVLLILVRFGTHLNEEFSFDQVTEERATIDAGTIPRLPMLQHPPETLEAGMTWLTPDHDLMIVVPEARGYDPLNPDVDESGQPLPPKLDIRRIALTKSTSLSQEFQLTSYVNFVLMISLGMVIAFQTPLVVLLLGWLDLVRIDWLRKNRRYAVFGAAVLGAMLTPADPGSMLAMFIPLYLLYELGILLLQLFPAWRVAGVNPTWQSDNGNADFDQPAQSDDTTSTTRENPSKRDDSADNHDQENTDG